MKHSILPVFFAVALAVVTAFAQAQGFLPGRRVLLDAHNCYPYEGMWTNRIERALSTGVPLAIEVDLVSDSIPTSAVPRIVVRHGGKPKPGEPTLEDWFFAKVRPLVEQAIQDGNRSAWPLVTLNINDLRAGNFEFFTALWNLMGLHEAWLCTAVRTANLHEVSPLQVKPILVLTSDGKHQRKIFHDDVPVGGTLRMFAAGKPEQNADNFCRWVNYPWKAVEPEGQTRAGDWSTDDAARLKSLVENAHRRGYWIRFYTLNGHGPLDVARLGLSPGYNFGSLEAVTIRWQAARSAGVDFVASDQYEACAKALRGR